MHTFSNNSLYLYEHTQFHACFTNIKCQFQGQESSDCGCVCRLKSFGLNVDIVISMASCKVYKNVMMQYWLLAVKSYYIPLELRRIGVNKTLQINVEYMS